MLVFQNFNKTTYFSNDDNDFRIIIHPCLNFILFQFNSNSFLTQKSIDSEVYYFFYYTVNFITSFEKINKNLGVKNQNWKALWELV